MTLRTIARKAATGRVSCESLVRDAFRKIEDPGGQGAVAFRELRLIQAVEEASRLDATDVKLALSR